MWDLKKYHEYVEKLKKEQDKKYLEFNQKIVLPKKEMIGIRVPILRQKAKEIAKTDISSFIACYDGKYFEETMILGFVIGYSKDIIIYDKYLPFFVKEITDWSICDSSVKSLTLIGEERKHFYHFILSLINTDNEFEVRFALVALLNYYLTDNYIDEIIEICLKVKSSKYYINMALAWLISEMYIKFPKKVDKIINQKALNTFVLNKTISKICDSYRVSKTDKEMLKKRKK